MFLRSLMLAMVNLKIPCQNVIVASSQPAMVPSDLPVDLVLQRATGQRFEEAEELSDLLQSISGKEPVVWAGKILGFGEYTYRYPSGHSGISPLLAFAPGPKHHTLYLVSDFATKWPEILEKLGPHRASKACLYITRLSKCDRDALRELLNASLAETLGESSS